MFKEDEIKAKIGIKTKITDVIIPPNHLSLPLNMAKSQGANMPIHQICSLFPFKVSSSFSHASSISIYISPLPPSSKNPSSSPSIDHSFLISKINILLSSLPCLTKSYLKMGGRKLSSLAEVPLEWSLPSYTKHAVLPANTLCSPAPPPLHSIQKNTRLPSSSVCP